MKIRWLPMAAIFLALSATTSYANGSKTRLECDVEVLNTFSGGNIERLNERIQLDVETAGKAVLIEANGQDVEFLISNTLKPKSVVQIDDFSNADLYSFAVKHQTEVGLIVTQVRLDRVTGRLDYLWAPASRTGMTKKITGKCKKIEAATRRF